MTVKRKKKLTPVELSRLLSYAAVEPVGYQPACGCLIDIAVNDAPLTSAAGDTRRYDADLENESWEADIGLARPTDPETVLRVMERAGLA